MTKTAPASDPKDNGKDNEVAIPQVKYTDTELRAIAESTNAFDAAMAVVSEHLGGETVADASTELGTGFVLVEDKNALIGRPMLLMSWAFNAGKQGNFVSVTAVTQDGGKYIFNDGGSGVCAQLEDYTQRTGRQAGLLVRKGLRKSEYSNALTDDGVTFYLNTSA